MKFEIWGWLRGRDLRFEIGGVGMREGQKNQLRTGARLGGIARWAVRMGMWAFHTSEKVGPELVVAGEGGVGREAGDFALGSFDLFWARLALPRN